MPKDTNTAGVGAGSDAGSKRAAKAKGVSPGTGPKAPKEHPAEAALHELFRLAKVDTRSSDHGRNLVASVVNSLLKGGK